jgi:signal transduction histidine kinase
LENPPSIDEGKSEGESVENRSTTECGGDVSDLIIYKNGLAHLIFRKMEFPTGRDPDQAEEIATAHKLKDGTPATWVRIQVEDSGIGIKPEVLGKLFKPFVQGTRYSEYGGTGLGLSIAKRLCGEKPCSLNALMRLGACQR